MRPPNIVLLIADDLGWPYAGFMGDPVVRTPNLDALAAQGTTFVNAQTPSSLCVPAQRALLAGIHSEQWERKRSALETAFGSLRVRTEVEFYRTLPRELARRGYLAWEGGKLWDGTFASAGFTHGLATSVFSDWVRSAGDDFGREGWSDGSVLAPLQGFLDQVAGQPFFLWIAPELPHLPYDAPAEFAAPYVALGLEPEVARYYANVSWLDALAGALLAELDARGLGNDTLVVFLSDNGKDATHDIAGVGQGKGTLYELGFRQPLILRWPGHVPAGVRRDDLVSTLDVPATLLDYAGADALEDGGGRSLRSAIEGGTPVDRDRLVSRFRGPTPANDGYWVRTPSWRYLTAADGREELYAIDVDPLEQLNVAALHPELLPGFRAEVVDWQAQLDAGRPSLDVAGHLSDAQGAPLAGENVELVGRSAARQRVRLRVLTSPHGDFLFESVPLGDYKLRSLRPSARLSFRYRRGRVPVPLPAASLDAFLPVQGEQEIPAAQAGRATLRGTVRDGAGGAIAAATESLRATIGQRKISVVLRSGADGTYRAEWLPAGAYSVAATSRGRRPTSPATVILGGSDDRVYDPTVS